MKALIIVTA